MEFKASHHDIEASSSPRFAGRSRPDRPGDSRSNPRSRRVNRSTRADAFADFSAEVLRDLNPRGPLESALAGHVAASAWRLKLASGRQAARDSDAMGSPDGPADAPKRHAPSAADRAARSVTDALEAFDRIRSGRSRYQAPAPVEPADFASSEVVIESNEWPVVPFHRLDESMEDESIDLEDEAPAWQDRLVFDFEVSEASPVVKGTWITVGHVVSLIVDGQTWADILRSHPELTEEDIRICVAFAVAQDRDAT